MAQALNSSSMKYETLDGLRGIAAISIVILHTPHFFGGWKLPISFLAVDLFFLLSGFVLASAYESRFSRGLSTKDFIVLRLIRLYPLYFLSTIMGIPIAILAMRHGGLGVQWDPAMLFASIPLSLLMFPTPQMGISDVIYPLNPVLWSIFFEVLINIIYVLFWPLLRSTVSLTFTVIVCGIFLVIYSLNTGTMDIGYSWTTIFGGMLRVSFSFFFGVLLFRLIGGRKRRVSWLALLAIAAVPLIFFAPKNIWLEIITVLLIFPALLVYSIKLEPAGWAQRFFSILGLSSYAIYVLHKPAYQLILGGLTYYRPGLAESWAPWIGIAYIPILLVICILVDKYYDFPIRRKLTSYVKGKKTYQPTPA